MLNLSGSSGNLDSTDSRQNSKNIFLNKNRDKNIVLEKPREIGVIEII